MEVNHELSGDSVSRVSISQQFVDSDQSSSMVDMIGLSTTGVEYLIV